MFDPKSLLDALVRGNAQQSPGASSGGGLEDLLRNFLPNAGAGASQGGSPQTSNLQPEQGSSGNPLGDLLSKLQQGGQGGGGLGDILGKLQQQAGGAGGIADILGQVFGQAKSGVREGAGRIDQATGASDRMRDALGQLTGRSPDELVAQLKELMANNKMGAGAALGGLGALILGNVVAMTAIVGTIAHRRAGVPGRRQWNAVRPSVLAAVPAWLATSGASTAAGSAPAGLALALSLVCGVGAYAATLWTLDRTVLANARGQLGRILSRAADEPPRHAGCGRRGADGKDRGRSARRAADGFRTRDLELGKLALYLLSYRRRAGHFRSHL